jgi:hypothetical protein
MPLLLHERLLELIIFLLMFMFSDFPSFLVGAPIMHQFKNVKKILKVGSLLTTGI